MRVDLALEIRKFVLQPPLKKRQRMKLLFYMPALFDRRRHLGRHINGRNLSGQPLRLYAKLADLLAQLLDAIAAANKRAHHNMARARYCGLHAEREVRRLAQ